AVFSASNASCLSSSIASLCRTFSARWSVVFMKFFKLSSCTKVTKSNLEYNHFHYFSGRSVNQPKTMRFMSTILRRFVLAFILILSFQPANGQPYPQNDFRSPLDIPIILSGTFGELRGNHF